MKPEEQSPPGGEHNPPSLDGDTSRVRLWQGPGSRSSGEQSAPTQKRSTLLRLKQLTEERLKRLSGLFSRPPEAPPEEKPLPPLPASDSGERERVRLWQPKPEGGSRPPSRTTLARLKQLEEEMGAEVSEAPAEPAAEPEATGAVPEPARPEVAEAGAQDRERARLWQGRLKPPEGQRRPDRMRERLKRAVPKKRHSTLAKLRKRATFGMVKMTQSMPQLTGEAPLGGRTGFVTEEDFPELTPEHPTIKGLRPEEPPPQKKYKAPSMLLRQVEEVSRALEAETAAEAEAEAQAVPQEQVPEAPEVEEEVEEEELAEAPAPRARPRRREAPLEPPPPDIVVPRVSLEELTTFTRQFAVMLEAGVQVHEVLHFLSEAEEMKLAPVLGEVARRVDTGSTLSWAMRAFPTVFSEIYVGMISIGENSGGLSDVLLKLADLMEKQVRLQKKIVSSLAYPVILATVGSLGTLAFVYWVVPIMLTLFESVNHELPLATRMLVAVRNWLPFLATLVLVTAVSLWLARPYIRRYLHDHPLLLVTLHGLPLTLPQIGPLVSKVVTARMMFAVATLLDTGLSVVPALVNASSVIGNRWIASRIELAQRDIMEGCTVSEALGRHGVVPDNAVSMLSVGEESARLPAMVRRVAAFYEEEVDLVLMTLSSLLEPAIMLVMGLVVGFVAFAAISPTVQLLNVL